MRCFFAIELPDEVKSAVAGLVRNLSATDVKASWTEADNLHLTLRFLGDIDVGPLAEVSTRLQEAAEVIPSFPMRIALCGAFPNVRAPRILWAGVYPVANELLRLGEAAESAAILTGLEPERRPFRPHITLARVRSIGKSGSLATAMHEAAGFDGGSFMVDSVSLFCSELTQQGAQYTRLNRFPLR